MSLLTALLLPSSVDKYSPDQPRDEHGKWTGGGSGEKQEDITDVTHRVAQRLEIESDPDMKGQMRQEYSDLVRKQLGNTFNKLSFQQKAALQEYSDHGYKTINNILRTGKPLSQCEDCSHIDSAIAAAKLPDNMNLYRGATLNTSTIDSLKPGSVISDKGYVSTSASTRIAYEFANKQTRAANEEMVVFEIQAPKSSRGLATSLLPDGFPVEREVLLPRNSQFQVQSVSKLDHQGFSTRVVSVKYLGAKQ